jgi:hypothetical protein
VLDPDTLVRLRAHGRIVADIQGRSDRITAIVGAAYLEARLKEAIASRCVPGVDHVEGQFLKRTDFSLLTHCAFALGLIGPKTRRDLLWIGEIRNAFAHQPDEVSFSQSWIAHHCAELHWGDIRFGLRARRAKSPKARYARAVLGIWHLLWSEIVQGTPGKASRFLP